MALERGVAAAFLAGALAAAACGTLVAAASLAAAADAAAFSALVVVGLATLAAARDFVAASNRTLPAPTQEVAEAQLQRHTEKNRGQASPWATV